MKLSMISGCPCEDYEGQMLNLEMIAEKVKSRDFSISKKQVMSVKGPCFASLVVLDGPYHEVKTKEEMPIENASKR